MRIVSDASIRTNFPQIVQLYVIKCHGIQCEYVDYYFSQESTYLNMYGGSIAPSLIPRYATDCVVHKEAVRQLFIDGVGNFLFDMKKESFPPLPFCIGSYKLTRVKRAP